MTTVIVKSQKTSEIRKTSEIGKWFLGRKRKTNEKGNEKTPGGTSRIQTP